MSSGKSGTLMGSSPRVRGTVFIPFVTCKHNGIIPACAGNSRGQALITWRKRDHPRVCGEQESFKTIAFVCMGSSPRVRGTAFPVDRLTSLKGIIPACAGNREREDGSEPLRRDHPRVCGEQSFLHLISNFFKGSSPRVRGTAGNGKQLATVGGIIPACAGNRS